MEKYIKVYATLWTYDDIEAGESSDNWEEDTVDCTPDQYDIDDRLNHADIAAAYLNREGYFDTSTYPFQPGTWYSLMSEDYRSGDSTEYTAHLHGFTEEEEKYIYSKTRGK